MGSVELGRTLAVAIVVVAAAGCASDPAPPRSVGPGSTTGSETGASPRATAPKDLITEPVGLPPLPEQGLVIARRHAVEFVDLDANVLHRLPGFRLYFDWTVPGPVILRRHREHYLLDVGAHLLRPVGSSATAAHFAPQFQEGLDLERPEDAPEGSGSWAYALASPDGGAFLGQWTGECEVPVAFFLGADGRDPQAAFGGGGLGGAAESRGLGWTTDGAAVVHLMQGECGRGGRPGIYAIRLGGSSRLVLPLPVVASRQYNRFPGLGAVRMWGTA